MTEFGHTGSAKARYVGEVAYIYAFDVAYDMVRRPLRELLGQPVAQFAVDASKRSPRQIFFYRPQMVHFAPEERYGPHGAMRVERSVKLLPIGAISITVRVPFAVDRLEDLVEYHDLQFNNGSLQAEVKQLAEQIRTELKLSYIRPVAQLGDEEAYTVFCFQAPEAIAGAVFRAETWRQEHSREIAALLTQEPDSAHLSEQEAEESAGLYLSYYEHDIVVMDWDAALIVDHPRHFDETLYILELANVQLAELEAYDRLLDDALERSYRDLSGASTRSRGAILQELREIRVDMARLSDELQNITKFFGDWHLARLYQKISARFHLADWHRSLDEKLKTLDELYQILQHDQTNRWMLILEVTVVLLFILDLALLFGGFHK